MEMEAGHSTTHKRAAFSPLPEKLEVLKGNPDVRMDSGWYFTSYGDVRVHALMLRDRLRVAAYATAIAALAPVLRGKRVMDLGAGSGILSFLAASAGAREVLAVEASSQCAALLQQHVFHNEKTGKIPPGVVKVLNCAVEGLPAHADFNSEWLGGIDAIISEWMGFYLVHEGMLESLLCARDMFLKPDSGLLLPCSARVMLSLASCERVYRENVSFLSNYCGFSFESMQNALLRHFSISPLVHQLQQEECDLCCPRAVLNLDLYSMTQEQVGILRADTMLTVKDDATVHAFAIWFDVTFPGKHPSSLLHSIFRVHPAAPSPEAVRRFKNALTQACTFQQNRGSINIQQAAKEAVAAAALDISLGREDLGTDDCSRMHQATIFVEKVAASMAPVVLDTSPYSPETHWKQLLVLLPQPMQACKGMSLKLQLTLERQHLNPRLYSIAVEVTEVNFPHDASTRDPGKDE